MRRSMHRFSSLAGGDKLAMAGEQSEGSRQWGSNTAPTVQQDELVCAVSRKSFISL